MRFELTRAAAHSALNAARLPVPPLAYSIPDWTRTNGLFDVNEVFSPAKLQEYVIYFLI